MGYLGGRDRICAWTQPYALSLTSYYYAEIPDNSRVQYWDPHAAQFPEGPDWLT